MKNYIITGLCLVIVGMIIAFLTRSTPPVPTGTLSKEQEDELRASVVTLEGRFDSLKREWDNSKAKGIEAQEVFKKEIKAKTKKIEDFKANPVIIEVAKVYPEVDSLHQAYDSAIAAYEGRIIELTNELQMRDKIALQAKVNFEERIAATEKLLSDSEEENFSLKQNNRKLKRGRVLRNVLIPVALVGGIWLGLQADR